MDYILHWKEWILLLTGIVFSGGCSLSAKKESAPATDVFANAAAQAVSNPSNGALLPPKAPTAIPLHDPFLAHSVPEEKTANRGDIPQHNKKEEEKKTKTLIPPPPPKETRSKVLQELQELEGDSVRITLADEEEILSQDLWVKNILLDRSQDANSDIGKTRRNTVDRKRSEEINRLNMSNKERRKSQNTDYVYESEVRSVWRWFHRELEQLAAVSPQERENPMLFLTEKKYQGKNYRILRANAAIMLGRTETENAAELIPILFEVIQDSALRTELRCAAAETLGKYSETPPEELIPLLEDYKEKETEVTDKKTGLSVKKTQAGIPLLWLELLNALAGKMEPWEHPCFLEPFSARNYDTRLQIAKLWRRRSDSSESKPARLPSEYLDLVQQEPSSAVRAEMLRTLGIWKEPRIFELVRADLNRETLVRNAALDALAEARCEEAVPAIQQKLNDTAAANRLKAVRTLAAIGSLDGIHKLSNDSDAEVRRAVAEVLGRDLDENDGEQENEVPSAQSALQPILEHLEGSVAAKRREAAAELQQLSEGTAFGKDVVERIIKCIQTENDPFILSVLFNALQSSDGAAARQAAEAFGDSELSELRKIFCDVMSEVGTMKDVPLLAEKLDDPNRSVTAASIAALTAILREQDAVSLLRAKETVRELAEWLNVLNERNVNPHFERDAGVILHIINEPGGTETLRRILHTGDVSIKCGTIRKIGELEDPIFVPDLIQLLDDGNGSVRQAALNALPKIAGQDIGKTKPDASGDVSVVLTSQKIERWKRWYEERDKR